MASPAVSLSPVRRTGQSASLYAELLARVKAEGLLAKEPGFYLKLLAGVTVVAVGLWGALVAVAVAVPGGWVWVAFPIAALLGVTSAQYGFVAHEAAHRQVFPSSRANDVAGMILANGFAGLSYGFWLRKHNAHHAKPNQVGADPDINLRVLAFTVEQRDAKPAGERWFTRRQGWLFPVLLLFTGFDLLLDSLLAVTSRRGRNKRANHKAVEFSLMLVRQLFPFVVFSLLFGVWMGAALWLVQMLAFGFFMGAAFAPNHKGMPLVPRDSTVDFFTRQVLTSRNITGGRATDLLMGGLNYQAEHHLFPSMARPHLARTHELTVEFCTEKGVPFTEMRLLASYGVVIDHLNRVGLSGNVDPFVCPMIAELRPRN
jgi:fatty acid desaturase